MQALDLESIRTHHWKIWPCSALTGDNLVQGLDWVVDDVATRLYYSTTTTQRDSTHVLSEGWIQFLALDSDLTQKLNYFFKLMKNIFLLTHLLYNRYKWMRFYLSTVSRQRQSTPLLSSPIGNSSVLPPRISFISMPRNRLSSVKLAEILFSYLSKSSQRSRQSSQRFVSGTSSKHELLSEMPSCIKPNGISPLWRPVADIAPAGIQLS